LVEQRSFKFTKSFMFRKKQLKHNYVLGKWPRENGKSHFKVIAVKLVHTVIAIIFFVAQLFTILRTTQTLDCICFDFLVFKFLLNSSTKWLWLNCWD
jgi:hypothetical protein